MKIITNHHWRQFLYRDEVPASVLADDFDWLSDEESWDGFFRYRGGWYHLSEFVSNNDPDLAYWHGVYSRSFFSAVLIHLSCDCEEYQVALAIS